MGCKHCCSDRATRTGKLKVSINLCHSQLKFLCARILRHHGVQNPALALSHGCEVEWLLPRKNPFAWFQLHLANLILLSSLPTWSGQQKPLGTPLSGRQSSSARPDCSKLPFWGTPPCLDKLQNFHKENLKKMHHNNTSCRHNAQLLLFLSRGTSCRANNFGTSRLLSSRAQMLHTKVTMPHFAHQHVGSSCHKDWWQQQAQRLPTAKLLQHTSSLLPMFQGLTGTNETAQHIELSAFRIRHLPPGEHDVLQTKHYHVSCGDGRSKILKHKRVSRHHLRSWRNKMCPFLFTRTPPEQGDALWAGLSPRLMLKSL